MSRMLLGPPPPSTPATTTQESYIAGLERKLQRIGGDTAIRPLEPIAASEGGPLAKGTAELLSRLACSEVDHGHCTTRTKIDDALPHTTAFNVNDHSMLDDTDSEKCDGACDALLLCKNEINAQVEGNMVRRYEYIDGPNSSDSETDMVSDTDEDEGILHEERYRVLVTNLRQVRRSSCCERCNPQ